MACAAKIFRLTWRKGGDTNVEDVLMGVNQSLV